MAVPFLDAVTDFCDDTEEHLHDKGKSIWHNYKAEQSLHNPGHLFCWFAFSANVVLCLVNFFLNLKRKLFINLLFQDCQQSIILSAVSAVFGTSLCREIILIHYPFNMISDHQSHWLWWKSTLFIERESDDFSGEANGPGDYSALHCFVLLCPDWFFDK